MEYQFQFQFQFQFQCRGYNAEVYKWALLLRKPDNSQKLSEFQKLQLKIRGLRAKKCYFSYYYDFERNYDVSMSCQRVHAFC